MKRYRRGDRDPDPIWPYRIMVQQQLMLADMVAWCESYDLDHAQYHIHWVNLIDNVNYVILEFDHSEPAMMFALTWMARRADLQR